MSEMHNLQEILKSLDPQLSPNVFVFATIETRLLSKVVNYDPIGTFREKEGLTLILRKETAIINNLEYQGEFRRITLGAHSSLESVGLTAIVSNELAKADISVNVWAAYHHDHIFVPVDDAKNALQILKDLQDKA